MPDQLPLQKISHVELWVGNAKLTAYYYRHAFGFSRVAYAGPETGWRHAASYVLEQGDIRLVITSPMSGDSPIAEHVSKHGDGVRDIAFSVEDVDFCFREAVKRGAEAGLEPSDVTDDYGTVRQASIRTFGDTVHSFVCRQKYSGPFLPGYRDDPLPHDGVGLQSIDHIVGNVELGKMDFWQAWYEKVLGFHQLVSFDDRDISTKQSALRSKVMASENGSIKLPINEPAVGLRRSQVQEYLDFYQGPGIQQVAMSTRNIVSTAAQLRDNGVDFIHVPENYYEQMWQRVGVIEEDQEGVRKNGLLVDRDDEGYLLQLFTQPVEDRPTLFYAVIQRNGAQSLGKGNLKALFEAMEREQAARGNL